MEMVFNCILTLKPKDRGYTWKVLTENLDGSVSFGVSNFLITFFQCVCLLRRGENHCLYSNKLEEDKPYARKTGNKRLGK